MKMLLEPVAPTDFVLTKELTTRLPGVKPVGPVEIDWNHPLTKPALIGSAGGLAYAFLDGVELIDNLIVESSYSKDKFSYQSIGYTAPTGTRNKLAGDEDSCQLLCRVRVDDVTGNNDIIVMLGQYTNSSDSGGVMLLKNGSDRMVFTVLNNTGTGVDVAASSTTPSAGEVLTIYGRYISGVSGSTHIKIFEWNEEATNSSLSINNKRDTSPPTLRFGKDTSNRSHGVEFAYIWTGNLLTDAQIEGLAQDPYQFLQPAGTAPKHIRHVTPEPEDIIVPDSRWEMPELLYPGRKPIGDVVIDWSHPLAKGLVRAMVMTDSSLYDLAASNLGTTESTPDFGHGDPSYPVDHLAWFFDRTTAEEAINMGSFSANTGDLSVSMRAKWTNNDSDTSQLLVGDGGTAAHTDRVFQFRIEENADPCDLRLIVFIGGATKVVTASAIFPLREDIVAGFTHDSAVGQEIYLDGTSVGSGANTGNIDSETTQLRIGAFYDVDTTDWRNGFTGSVSHVYVWDRPLSAEEHASISLDPYQFLIPA